jgi:hypothetical protein
LLLQLNERFSSVDKKITAITEKKLRLHLWYLGEDLADLPLLNDEVNDQEKAAIINAL